MNEITTGENIRNIIPAADPEMEAMLRAGVHLGHAKSKNHPSMLPYIFGTRNTVSVIDLSKTKEKLALAEEFIKKIAARGGMILLVGTRPAARKSILELARKTNMPYFVERWIGGTLTNFKVIAKRVEYMESLEKEKASGDFEKYTKKERMIKEKEMEKLKGNFDGLRSLKRLPDAVFVVDVTHDLIAVREAKRMKIPVVGLTDTNSNFNLIDWPIPSNDDAPSAVKYMIERIEKVIEQGQEDQKTQSTEVQVQAQ